MNARGKIARYAIGASLLALFVISAFHLRAAAQPQLCPPNAEQYECWKEHILDAFAAGGLPKALVMFDGFFKDPGFGASCHNLAHLLGRAAYAQFKNGEKLTYSPVMEMCAYGFFHGFMEKLVAVTGSATQAKKFCKTVQAIGPNPTSGRSVCYHGIGHGLILGYAENAYTNIGATISNSLTFCRSVSDTDQDYIDCASGVFNGLADDYYAGHYGMTNAGPDTLKLCAPLTGPLASECYGYMVRMLLKPSPGTFASALSLLPSYIPSAYASGSIYYLATFYGITKPHAPAEIAADCARLPDTEAPECFSSYAVGIIQSEEVAQGAADAGSFCSLAPERFRVRCFEGVFRQLSRYSAANTASSTLCNAFSQNVRGACETAQKTTDQ